MPDRPIHRRIAAHVRGRAVGYVAVFVLALGVGGGYALASSKTKTITVCADKKTGVLHLKTRGRCKRSQTRVSWNQRGPQGVRGPQGAAGARGADGRPGYAGAARARGGQRLGAMSPTRDPCRCGSGRLRAARLRGQLPGDDHRSGVRPRIQRARGERLGLQSPGRAERRRIPGGLVRSYRGEPAVHRVHRSRRRPAHSRRPTTRSMSRTPVSDW